MGKTEKESNTALLTPDVNSKLNMNLNQNDLIEMVVNEQAEKLEAQMDSLEEDIKKLEEAEKLIKQDYILQTRKKIQANKKFKQFCDAVNVLGLKLTNENLTFASCGSHNCSYEITEKFHTLDMNRVENMKNPLRGIKSSTYLHENSTYLNNKLHFSIQGRDDDKNESGSIDMQFQKNMVLSQGEFNKYCVQRKDIIQRICEAKDDLVEVQTMYLKVKYGADRMRTKFVKKALETSPEGINILNMLEQATNHKLLGN